MDELDDRFQSILFEIHRDCECAATCAAIEFATDEIRLAMRRAYELGQASVNGIPFARTEMVSCDPAPDAARGPASIGKTYKL